jgi:type IX secretion system PorP/SprF family membrane protein
MIKSMKYKINRYKTVAAVFMLCFMAAHEIQAQSDIMLTQQWLSRVNMNPAATGNSESIDIYVLARRQWDGFDNAPETGVLNVHSYFHRIQSGLGLTATYDKIGVGTSMINAKIAYAYHVNLGEKWLLSLGLSGGIIQQQFKPNDHYVIPGQDDGYLLQSASKLNPDVDFGIELNSRRFQFGASVTHLLNVANLSMLEGSQIVQQYHAYASYKQPLGENFDLMLGVRGTNFDSSPFVDVNLTGILLKNYWLGVAYRPQQLSDPLNAQTVAAMVGVQIAFVRVGYSFDYSLGSVRNIARNSHEIMLSFKINKPKRQIHTKSPRFIEDL